MTDKIVLYLSDVKELSNYAHWIPITKGLHLELFNKKYPGWEWNNFVPKLLHEKVITLKETQNSIKLFQGLFISSSIHSIEFTRCDRLISISINKKVGE